MIELLSQGSLIVLSDLLARVHHDAAGVELHPGSRGLDGSLVQGGNSSGSLGLGHITAAQGIQTGLKSSSISQCNSARQSIPSTRSHKILVST
jgi:hypothetical protein